MDITPRDTASARTPASDGSKAMVNRSPRVLVVEDEHDIAGLIKHALERAGDGQVQIVSSGDAALRAITEQPPDVIILDLNLPVLSGTEVCRIVRSRPATANIPIIMRQCRCRPAVAAWSAGAVRRVRGVSAILRLRMRPAGRSSRATTPRIPARVVPRAGERDM